MDQEITDKKIKKKSSHQRTMMFQKHCSTLSKMNIPIQSVDIQKFYNSIYLDKCDWLCYLKIQMARIAQEKGRPDRALALRKTYVDDINGS